MADLIRRSDAVISIENSGLDEYCREKLEEYLIGRINALPAVDAVEVRHGEWIPKNSDGSWRVDTCSECKKDTHYVRYAPAYTYCPNCGARMDREDGDVG